MGAVTTKKSIKPISQERLNCLFSYDPTEGVLRWRKRELSDFASEGAHRAWNTKYAGKATGSKGRLANGDKSTTMVGIDGVLYKTHRLIWIMVHGSIPDGNVIDHINRDPFDNRLSNLRACTKLQNSCNRGTRRDNKSGYKGVCWHRGTRKWCSYITVNKRQISLGYFNTKWGAYAEYRNHLHLHGEFGLLSTRPRSHDV